MPVDSMNREYRVRSFKEPAEAVKHFATGLHEGRHLNQEAHQYGYALALSANHKHEKAEQIIEKMLQKRPEQAEYVLASAKFAKELKKPKKALKILDTYYSLMPENYPISITYIEALTENGDLAKARQVTQQILSMRESDPRLYRLLSKIEQLDGRKAESHRMLAEAYVASGEFQPAIQQLEIALKEVDPPDFYETSKIESRMKRLRNLVKEQQKKDHR
ncbi:MAG: tetratricopeptide repeat protein [Candidatus Thiodiazotropha sp. 6PLUC5]